MEIRLFCDASVGSAWVGRELSGFAGVAWKIRSKRKTLQLDSSVVEGCRDSRHGELAAIARGLAALELLLGDKLAAVSLALHTDNEHAYKTLRYSASSVCFDGVPVYAILGACAHWRVHLTKDTDCANMRDVDHLSRQTMKAHRAALQERFDSGTGHRP